MQIRKGEWALILFNLVYIILFTLYYVSIKNFEFLWYVAVLVFFFVLIVSTIRRSKFDYVILWGLTIWGLLHMAGGGIRIDGGVLYGLQIISIVTNGEFTILKYDQLVHFFGFGVSTLVVYHLLKPYLLPTTNWKVVYPILVVSGMGLGVLNEIVEFIAVLTFPETGVGGYANTALDLVANTLGATAAVFFIHIRRTRTKEAAITVEDSIDK